LEVNVRAQTARNIITGFSRAIPTLSDLWQQVSDSLSDIPALISEVTRLASELASVRLDRADLAAAGRATLAAIRNGEPDPLSYLRDELTAQGFYRGRP
jgi:hypothetical protein